MPEPLVYLESMLAAAATSVFLILATQQWFRRSPQGAAANHLRENSTCVAALAAGLVAGYFVLALQLRWPPASGLDRLLMIVLPATICIELFAPFLCAPRSVWLLRACLVAITPRLLLHGSVYLNGDEWSPAEAFATMGCASALLLAVMAFLTQLQKRTPGVSIPFSLGMAILSTGIAVMLAAYLRGGAAALPFATLLVATAIATHYSAKRSEISRSDRQSSIVVIGVVGLFGLLFVGTYFGRLTNVRAVTILVAPLLCWATETPFFRNRNRWLVGTIRLTLVSIPLLTVLFFAKLDFDREFAPLIENRLDVRQTPGEHQLARRQKTTTSMSTINGGGIAQGTLVQ